MNYSKPILCILSIVLFQASFIQTDTTKTPTLIDYLQQRDRDFANLNKEIQQLERKIHEYQHTLNYYPLSFYERLDIQAQRNSKQNDLWHQSGQANNFEKNSSQEILRLIEQGASVNAVDSAGKTALNYIASYASYHDLRAAGADFQLAPFMYFHPKTTATAMTISLATLYALYKFEYFSYKRCAQYAQKKQSYIRQKITGVKNFIYAVEPEKAENLYDVHNLQSIDLQGRTPLMNYIIEQEQALMELRSQITALENKTEKKDVHYATLVEHKNLKDTTRAKIKLMIEQGAALDVEDAFGKSLLSYCATEDIYYDLQAAGAPFEIKPWIYFDSRKFGAGCFIVAGAVGIVALCLVGIDADAKRHRSTYNHY